MIGTFRNHLGTVADRIDITIARDYRRLGQGDGWWGEAWFPTASPVFPGEELTLELESGVSSPIVVERVTVDSRAGRMLVRFTGAGPLDAEPGVTGP